MNINVDIILLVQAAIMGIVEGLTEFLPISSTGHLILAGALLGFDDEKAKVFDIALQTGAIFAVILVYWQKIRSTLAALPTDKQAQQFALNVSIAFIPAVVLGLLLAKPLRPTCSGRRWLPQPSTLAILLFCGLKRGIKTTLLLPV